MLFKELEVCEFDDLTTSEKGVAIVNLYINNILQGTGTIKEIADKLGRTTNSIYGGLHRTKYGISKKTHYYVELVEWVEPNYARYEVFWMNKKTGEHMPIAKGTMSEISLVTGYTESYLRIRASHVANYKVKEKNKGVRHHKLELVVRRIDKSE